MRVLLFTSLLAAATAQYSFGLITHPLERTCHGRPRDCICLNSYQNVGDDIISGEYNYIDPVGSKITVFYSVNIDGTNYSETRKVTKGYKTDAITSTSTLISAKEIVKKIITDLKPSVIGIIRNIILTTNVDLNNHDNLVDTIMVKLAPVIEGSVNDALGTSQYGHLNSLEVIKLITIEIRLFVVEAIKKETTKTVTISEDEVIKQIIDSLRQTITRVIKTTVASSNFDMLQNQKSLVQQIIIKLKSVVSSSVLSALQNSGANFDTQAIINRIVFEITPLVEAGVAENVQIKIKEVESSQDQVIRQISKKLESTIVRIITTFITNNDVSKNTNLLQNIIVQLRPVILREVQNQISTTTINAQDLTDRLIKELTPFIKRVINTQVNKHNNEQVKVIKVVNKELQPIVLNVISETITASDLSNIDDLIQTIIIQLRPIVLREVKKALSTSIKYQGFNAERVTDQIMIEITKFVKNAVQLQIQTQQQELQISSNNVVEQVIKNLKPIVINDIKTFIQTSGTNVNDIQGLLKTILARLRPIVLREVQKALAASNMKGLDAEEITQTIVIRIEPIIVEGAQKVIKGSKGSQNVVIKEIINDVQPNIIRIISNLVKKSNDDLSNPLILENFGNDILRQLRPQILVMVKEAVAKSSNYDIGDAQELTDLIMIELRQFIMRVLYDEAKQFEFKVVKITPDIAEKIKTPLLEKIRVLIKNTVTEIMSSGQNLDQDYIIQQIMLKLQDDYLISLINKELNGIGQVGFPRSEMLRFLIQIRPLIRSIIIGEINLVRKQNTLDTETIKNTIQIIIRDLTDTIESQVSQIIKGSGSLTNDQITRQILSQITRLVIQNLERQLSGKIVISFSDFQKSENFNQIMNAIMRELRIIITKQIGVLKSTTQKPLVKPPKPPMKPSMMPGMMPNIKLPPRITNIFGDGGANSGVRLETPEYNYQYMLD